MAPLSLGHRLSAACWRAVEAACLSPKLPSAAGQATAEAAARCILVFADPESCGKEAGKKGHALPGEATEAIAVAAGEALHFGLAAADTRAAGRV